MKRSSAKRKRRQDKERRERRRVAHQLALAKQLIETAYRWREAQTARAFLKALGKRVPPKRRSPDFERWFSWATDYVELHHDPLARAEEVARSVDPATIAEPPDQWASALWVQVSSSEDEIHDRNNPALFDRARLERHAGLKRGPGW